VNTSKLTTAQARALRFIAAVVHRPGSRGFVHVHNRDVPEATARVLERMWLIEYARDAIGHKLSMARLTDAGRAALAEVTT